MTDRRRTFSAVVAAGQDPRSTILGVLEFTRDFLPQCSVDGRAQIKAAILVEELVSNSLRHGTRNQQKSGDLSLSLSLQDTGSAVIIELEDNGAPFDPTSNAGFGGPNPETGGGIGLAIVRAWGEDLTYTHAAGLNRIRLRIT